MGEKLRVIPDCQSRRGQCGAQLPALSVLSYETCGALQGPECPPLTNGGAL